MFPSIHLQSITIYKEIVVELFRAVDSSDCCLVALLTLISFMMTAKKSSSEVNIVQSPIVKLMLIGILQLRMG